MRLRIFWIVVALVDILIMTPIGISAYKDWQVYTKGTLAPVEIVSLPAIKGFMEFKLNGKIYHKRIISMAGNRMNVGDTIQLKYIKGHEGHFLYSTEDPMTGDIITLAMLGCILVGCIYYAYKKTSTGL